MDLRKVAGAANAADLVTKHLNQHAASKNLELLYTWTEVRRAEAAPKLSALAEHVQQTSPLADGWLTARAETIRAQRRPRTAFFTPMKVPGAPPAAELTPARITKGKFLNTGEEFCHVDCWTRRDGLAHLELGRKWTGTTCCFPRFSKRQ